MTTPPAWPTAPAWGKAAEAAAAGTLDGAPARRPKCRSPRLVGGGTLHQCGSCSYVLSSWHVLEWVTGYTFATQRGLLCYVWLSPRERADWLMCDPRRAVRRGHLAAAGWVEDAPDERGAVLSLTYTAPHAVARLTHTPDGSRYLLTVTDAAGTEVYRSEYTTHTPALNTGRSHAQATQPAPTAEGVLRP